MTPGSVSEASKNKREVEVLEIEAEVEDFKPLNAEEAQALRQKSPPVSPWRVIAGQVLLGFVVSLCAWGFTGQQAIGWSTAYGALAVVIPAALFARGLASPLLTKNAGAAVMGFFLWEAVKIALTVAMLFAAPRLITNLSWLAMLIGLVVVMKLYWFVPALGKLFRVQPKTNI